MAFDNPPARGGGAGRGGATGRGGAAGRGGSAAAGRPVAGRGGGDVSARRVPARSSTGRGLASRLESGGRDATPGRGHRASGPRRARVAGRGGPRAGTSRSTTLVPIAAAGIVLLMLLWYALAHDPSRSSGEPGANIAAAARAGLPDGGAGAATDGSGGGDGASVVVASPAPSGCKTGKTLPAGVTAETVTVGSAKRSYLLAVPPAAAGDNQPRPVILNFHGDGQAPTDLEAYTGLAGEATKRGYVVVVPAGVDKRWNFIRSSAVGPDDVAFVAALLNDLRGRGCLADDRVFATGFGDGADMAVAASCALPGRIAAIVSVAGATVPASCVKTVTNLLEIHGAADQIAPWDGGGAPRAAPFTGVTAQPVPDRLRRYAQAAGCGAEPKDEVLPGLGKLTAWTCDGKPDVGALSVTGGGHTWPQAQARPELGPTATSFSATVVSLLYFQAHPVVGSVVSADSPGIAGSLGSALAGG
ncbi:alpha/beta hydrolase family esterase [Pseudofrankia saprophytica]|uniref:alpha/beta hydrolase family esterase n=1 Tax=Pseudofrankia saprophytica TaxID=298655 RepID=UPI000686E38F|nr:PHB depolymerase family esterase [Pseudofrankia saprophytica]